MKVLNFSCILRNYISINEIIYYFFILLFESIISGRDVTYACMCNFKLSQMDVKSAFLNGFLNEVYVS